MKKYYFVYYKCKRYGWRPNGTSSGSHETECQTVVDIHPLQFQIDCNEKYGHERDIGGGYTAREEYTIVSWNELSEEEYFKYEGMVG